MDDFLRRVIAQRELEQRQAELARDHWNSPDNIALRKEAAALLVKKRGYAWALNDDAESDE